MNNKPYAWVTFKLWNIQVQNENNHFLGDLQMYDRKGDNSFSVWIVQAEKIANLTNHSELQLPHAKAEDIMYKLIEGMSYWSTMKTVKKRFCQVFSSVTKRYAATRIYS